jgi:hypothetical protein
MQINWISKQIYLGLFVGILMCLGILQLWSVSEKSLNSMRQVGGYLYTSTKPMLQV